MTPVSADPRAVAEYRVPARSLQTGDLVNTSPGEDDWQRVVSVYTADTPISGKPEIDELMVEIGDRYVLVEMTDVAPVDSNVYFADGTALVFGSDGAEDVLVTDLVSDPEARRIYLYTVFEVVAIRARP